MRIKAQKTQIFFILIWKRGHCLKEKILLSICLPLKEFPKLIIEMTCKYVQMNEQTDAQRAFSIENGNTEPLQCFSNVYEILEQHHHYRCRNRVKCGWQEMLFP